MSKEITIADACQYKHLNGLTPATKEVMVNAPQSLQSYLNTALMEVFNSSLCGASRGLYEAGFAAKQAVEVLYHTPGHREPVGNEIERAVDLIYGSASGEPVKKSLWPVFKTPIAEVLANIKQAGIEPMTESELLRRLGDTPEIDNVSDFLSEFFRGVELPIYLGTKKEGIIEYTTNWLRQPDVIEDEGYDQVLANPMRRKLTLDERSKCPSGGRKIEYASETLDVITFECDKIPDELQFAVIAYLAKRLPLLAIVDSANKSHHATFSAKGLSYDCVMRLRRAMVDLGGDGAVMSPYQLVRLGAVNRSDKGQGFQRVLWIDGDARNTPPTIENIAKLLIPPGANELTEIYFNKGKYHMLDPEGMRYIEMGDGDLTRQLRLQGLSPRGANGEMSAVDKVKANIVRHNTVDHVGALAGRSIGLHCDDTTGAKHLITRKNNRVVAKQGDCSGTIAILQAQYGEQFPYIISWLSRSRLQLDKEQFMQGHVLIIAGEPNGGKSLVASLAFQPLLGQVAKAGLYLAKGNDFNADLVGSELLLLDDEKLSMRMEDRRGFGLKLKSVCAGSGNVSRHGKGADAYNVNPLWRIVILVNDNDTDLGCLPPLGEGEDDTIGDKVLLLKCHKQPLPFAGDADQSAKLAALFKREEQAFAHFVDSYEIPASIRTGSCRFGFDHYHHPDLVRTLNANSNERTLLSATYDLIFRSDYLDVVLLDDISSGRKYWKGTALQWATILRSHKQHDAHGIVAGALAYGDTAIKAGIQLGKVAEVSDGRVMKDRITSGRLWIIWQPEDMDTVVADEDLF